MMFDLNKIFTRNKDWVIRKKSINNNFFKELSLGQNPNILYFGCSDSRVTFEQMIGAEPGEVFVHRNIANTVFPDDISAMSVLHYAINYLNIKHIIVCGHYRCGGIAAASDQNDYHIMNPYLEKIKLSWKKNIDKFEKIENTESKLRVLSELNVEQQCKNILHSDEVRNSRKNSQFPKIYGLIFDEKSGTLNHLFDC